MASARRGRDRRRARVGEQRVAPARAVRRREPAEVRERDRVVGDARRARDAVERRGVALGARAQDRAAVGRDGCRTPPTGAPSGSLAAEPVTVIAPIEPGAAIENVMGRARRASTSWRAGRSSRRTPARRRGCRARAAARRCPTTFTVCVPCTVFVAGDRDPQVERVRLAGRRSAACPAGPRGWRASRRSRRAASGAPVRRRARTSAPGSTVAALPLALSVRPIGSISRVTPAGRPGRRARDEAALRAEAGDVARAGDRGVERRARSRAGTSRRRHRSG